MRKNTEERFIPAEVTMSGRQATLAIDGNRLSISAEETTEESQEAVRKRLVLIAKLRRTTIKATITDSDGGRAILVHPDGEIEDAEEQKDCQESKPTILPAEMQADTDSKRGVGRAILKIIAALLVVAMLVVAGLIAWRVASGRSHERALASCSRQVRALEASERRATGPSSGFRRAVAVKADQVKDARTVDALRKTIKDMEGVRPQVIRCETSMPAGDLQAATGKAKRTDDVYRSLDKAAKAVLASRDAKSLDDAKKALDGKKDEASKLLGDSDGKVADNATRDGLQKAIDQAGQVKGGKAKAYQDAAAALQSAMDQVNASIQQKSQADQAAQTTPAPAPRQQPTQQLPAPSHGSSRAPARHPTGGTGRPASPQTSRPPAPSAPQGGWSVPPASGDDSTLPDHL